MIGFLIFLVAVVLSSILLPIGFIWGVGEALVNRGWKSGWERISDYFYDMALSVDQLGNVTCKELFNDVLIVNSSTNRFGNPDETISSVLGKNKRDNTLTKGGKVLASILDKLDKNHITNSIDQ
jgi:hypothetical protein